MTKRLSLVVVVAALLLAGRVVDIARSLTGLLGPSNHGIAADIEAGRFVVRAVARTDLAGVPLPAAAADLQVGDVVQEIVNARGGRFVVRSLGDLGDAMASLAVGEPWTVVVSRPAEDGTTTSVVVPVDGFVPPWRTRLVSLAFNGLVPVLAIFTALLISLLRPDDDAAFAGSLLFLGFSAAFSGDLLVQPRGLREVVGLLSGALTTSAVYFFMRFFLLFPSAAGLDLRLPWLKHAFAVPTVLLVLVIEVYTALSLVSFEWVTAFERVITRFWVEAAYGISFLLMFGIGLVSLLTHVIGAETRGARRRLGILLFGALVGLGPFVAAATYSMVAGEPQLSLGVSLAVVLALPMFPLAFIYAVVRHRVLGVGMIVRRGVQYALVSRGVLVAEAALVFAVLFFAVGPTLSRWLPRAQTGTIAALSAVATVGVTLALRGVNRRLRPLLDRQFYRSHYSPEEVLSQVSTLVKRLAAQPAQMVEAVAHVIGSALRPRHVAVYVDLARAGRRFDDARPADAVRATPHALVTWLAVDERSGELWPVTHRPPQALPQDDALARAILERTRRGDEIVDVGLDLPDMPFGLLGRTRAGDGAGPDARSGDAGAYQVLKWLGTAVLIPLMTPDGLLGWVSLGDKLSEEAYSPEDRALLRAVGGQLGMALEYAQLIGVVAEQEALRRELEIARQVQAELFPQVRPVLPGLDYAGSCRTAREVGGDYYDYLDLGPQRLGLAVGDITGKGISAALLMASLQAMLRSRAPLQSTDLGQLASEVNRLMVISTAPSKFATLFFTVYDVGARTLTYVNAGHNPAFLFPAAGGPPVPLMPTGMALGLSIKATYTEVSRRVDAGDLLVLYTDGVTEAMNGSGDDFGEERLVAVIERHRARRAVDIHDAVLDELDGFVGDAARHDDITLVVARSESN